MNFRKISIVLAVLLIVGAVFASNFLSKQSTPPPKQPAQKTANKVKTLLVKNQNIDAPITITGKLVSPEKIEIFAEVSGILLKGSQPFKEGNQFAVGSILVNIDDEETRLNLLAQKSALQNSITQMMPDMKLDYPDAYPKWQEYLSKFEVSKKLDALPTPTSDKEKYYVVTRNIYNQFYTIRSLEERLDKFKIIAPFSGVVAEASINPGTLVRVGQKLGEFINPYSYELEASVSIKDMDLIKVGNQADLYSEDISGSWKGIIKRISDRLDPTTQSVKIFVSVSGNRLKEGMFLRGDIKANQVENAFAIPRNLLLDQSRVYIVKNKQLVLQDVKVVRFTGNQVVVKGLNDEDKLLNENISNAYNGMKVEE